MVSRMACAAGYRPCVFAASMAGATVNPMAIFGLLGEPPGMR